MLRSMTGKAALTALAAVLISSILAGSASAAFLHDQYAVPAGDPPGARDSSQDFETSYDAFDTFLADDFEVPDGKVWQIRKIRAFGVFEGAATQVDSADAALYANQGGLPADQPYVKRDALTKLGDQSDGELSVPINRVAPAGINWISVQADLNFLPGDNQWSWLARNQVGLPAAYRNPLDGYEGGCTTWMRKIADCELASGLADQVFLLEGVEASARFKITKLQLKGARKLIATVNAPQLGNLKAKASGFKKGKTKVKKIGTAEVTLKPTKGTKKKLKKGRKVKTKVVAKLPKLAGEKLQASKSARLG